MRDFATMSIIPGAHLITVDDESYQCEPFDVSAIQGSRRAVPADRILAIWWDERASHGHVEGFGAGEGFFDRTVIEPYLKSWLAARAKARHTKVDDLVRKKSQDDDAIMAGAAAIEQLRSLIGGMEVSGDSGPQARARLMMARRHLDIAVAAHGKIVVTRTVDHHIAVASEDAAAADAEMEHAS